MNHDSSNTSIVVSGVGIVSPLGNGRELTWASLLRGETGIKSTPEGLEARVYDFSLNGARSRMGDFALLAADEALRHAGLTAKEWTDAPIGCVISQSKPLIDAAMDPTLLMSSFFGWSADQVVKREFKLAGPSTNVIAACATGVASIELGASWIRSGVCDMVLVGASESSLTSFYRAGFEQMGVLVHGAPSDVKPFDAKRSGFAMGEGAAVLVLEKLSSAQARGHQPLAKLGRTALHHSAMDSIRFDSDGSAVARLLNHVCAGNPPGYINAHGTGTHMNDLVETRGIKLALKEKASQVKISSTKAATGHLLGAAGAVEAAFCVLALRDQIVPPTLNLETPDVECDLDYTAGAAAQSDLSSALSLSYGFGGQMGAVSFEKI